MDSISADSVIAKYDELIQIAESNADADKLPQLMEELQYKKQLAVRCEAYKKYYKQTPRKHTRPLEPKKIEE